MARLLIAVAMCFSTVTVSADDFERECINNWHQWRGPDADGVGPNADPPLNWDDSTNILWKAEIPGSGNATPIVWGNHIFILTAVDTGEPPTAESPSNDSAATSTPEPAGPPRRGRKGAAGKPLQTTPRPTTVYRFDVICLDRESGKVRWQRTATQSVPHESHHTTTGYASASPTTDGKRLYVSFGSRGLFCFDFDGNLLWERKLGLMHTRREFGEGSSPVVHGDALVVNWDHEGDSFLTCLDAATGNDRWRVPRDEVTTWATPLIIEHEGVAQVVVNGTNRSRSYDLATGEILWQCGGQVTNPIPSPVAANGIVYCMSGYQGYAVSAIPLSSRGDITDLGQEVWHAADAAPYVSSPALVNNSLYFTKSESGVLCCLDASTGQSLYGKKRLPQLETIYSSPVAAAGRLYVTDRDGTTVVVRIGPEFEVLATNQLNDIVNATLVPIGGKLLIRGESTLYCVGVPEIAK